MEGLTPGDAEKMLWARLLLMFSSHDKTGSQHFVPSLPVSEEERLAVAGRVAVPAHPALAHPCTRAPRVPGGFFGRAAQPRPERTYGA